VEVAVLAVGTNGQAGPNRQVVQVVQVLHLQ
jgi:hypothetical protein